MKRRFFSLALALAALLGLCPPAAQASGVREAVPLLYDRVGDFQEDVGVVWREGQVGLINPEGQEVVPLGRYEELRDFSQSLGAARRKGRWGYLDPTGREAIPCELDYAGVGDFHEDRAAVWDQEGRMGFIDREGREVIPCCYFQVLDFSEGLAMTVSADDWSRGFVDPEGREMISCQYRYSWMNSFSGGRAAVQAPDGRWGFIDREGREVVPCRYTGVHDFSEGLALVITAGNRRGYIDPEGREVIPPQYETSGDFSQGLAVVSSFGGSTEGVGVIDREGRSMVPLGRYKTIRDFREGLAAVQDGEGKWGYIDREGREVIPCRYGYALSFSDGCAAVRRWGAEGGYGYVDRMGREVVPCQYDEARDFSGGLGAIGVHTGYQDASLTFACRWGFLSQRGTAYASHLTVLVDGTPMEFHGYALRDAAGSPTNYVRVRDVAEALNGTPAQFQVTWDGGVELEPGEPYTPNGSEMTAPFAGEQPCETVTAPTQVGGKETALDAILLRDADGGAYTYYKLRDLGAALGFTVDWSAERGILIETQ